jgi:hypothetical protein
MRADDRHRAGLHVADPVHDGEVRENDSALVQLGLAAALPVTPLVLTMIPTWVSVTRLLGVLP